MSSSGFIFRFGDVEVAPTRWRIFRAGVESTVEPKAFALLVVLLEQPGRTLRREELLDRVWGHRQASAGVLNRVVAQLRKALGEDAEYPRYIQTQHSLGYRFIAEVRRVVADGDDGATASAEPSAAGAALPVTMAAGPDRIRITARAQAGRRRYDAAAPAAGATPAERAAPATAATPVAPAALAAPVAVVASIAPVAVGAAMQRSPTWRRSGGVALVVALAAALLLAWSPRQPRTLHPQASVAVLPFISIGGAGADARFAERLAIGLHDALAEVPGLSVAALLSPRDAQRFKDAKTVGERLGVATVVHASVRRERGRLRIRAQLADTATGFVLWSRVYDRWPEDASATQREITGAVVHALLGVLPEPDRALADRPTPGANAPWQTPEPSPTPAAPE